MHDTNQLNISAQAIIKPKNILFKKILLKNQLKTNEQNVKHQVRVCVCEREIERQRERQEVTDKDHLNKYC